MKSVVTTTNTRPVIACYTCVKNEAKHVERWAETTEGADVRLWLDTGSTDDTIIQAQRHGIRVVSHPWDGPFHFARARNMACDLLPSNVDMAMQLDADETFRPGWLDAMRETHNPHHDRWSYWLTAAGNGSWGWIKRTNCHRPGTRFTWRHAVHEILTGPPPDAEIDGLIIEHAPDRTKKRTYYLDWMEHWHREEPDDTRLLFYLGRERMYRGDWAGAREALWDVVNRGDSTSGDRSESFIYLAQMDSDPERWWLQAVSACPERREPWFYYSQWLAKKRRYTEAKAMLDMAEARTDRGLYMTHRVAWDEHFDRFAGTLRSR